MTFVVSAVAARTAFQAADRLVSAGKAPWDPLSNKNVILRTTDSLITMGYSGLAYVGPVPMDWWLAETALSMELGSGIMLGSWPIPDLYQATQRVRTGLQQFLVAHNYTNRRQQVTISGLRIDRKKRVQPVVWSIVHEPARPGVVELYRNPGRNTPRAQFTCNFIGQHTNEITSWMRAELKGRGGNSPDDFEQVLVETVRRASQRFPTTVGSDVMSIRLGFDRQGKAHIKVNYAPSLKLGARTHPSEPSPAYSPWVLLPGAAYSPALISADGGGWEDEVAKFDVKVSGQTAVGLGFSWASAARRPAPGFRGAPRDRR